MPPRTALSTPLRAWKCPQCRALSTTPRQRALGPEHPRYISVPEPPQQDAPYLPFPKGRLPVPRDVFRGWKDKDKASDEEIAKAAPAPRRQFEHPKGSRAEWQQRLSESRRQNLQEGVKALRARKTKRDRSIAATSNAKIAAREAALRAPEPESERLTTPTTTLNVAKLLHGAPPDPDRETRIAIKAHNHKSQTSHLRSIRQDQLHTLYMRARSFIVTPAQLDAAVDEAFGTPENPKVFAGAGGTANGTSMWAAGKPEGLGDMMASATGKSKKGALDAAMGGAAGSAFAQAERMKRVAEELTGGEMEQRGL